MNRLLSIAAFAWSLNGMGADRTLPQGHRLPPPADLIIGGSDLAKALEPMTIKQREQAALELFQRGYFPDSLRQLKPISVEGNGHQLTYWVTPDYLSLGNDQDFVLLPLSWTSVKKLAQAWGFVLPTPKMVDQIFKQADRVIWPRALPPTREMVDMPYVIRHSQWIQAEEALQWEKDLLYAGHKKDIVMSSQLLKRKDKIAIYGWQNIVAGENIQPLCLWHGKNYVDYSHGVRMVARQMLLDGRLISMQDVLDNPETADLLSNEGAFSIDRILHVEAEEPVMALIKREGEGLR
jgi:hypothetical protein